MKEKASPLFSQYILDGQQMDQTPFSALFDCLDGNGTVDVPAGPFPDIIDEYLDKAPQSFEYREEDAEKYLSAILRTPFRRKSVDLDYPALWTISAIDNLLLETMFREGHFTLQDLLLMAKWDWNNTPAGNMAAFWESTVAAGSFLFDLGVKLDRYFVEENRRECTLDLSVRNRLPSRRICPDTMESNPGDWLIYIPFATGRRHLGGSALSQVIGHGAGAETDLSDADYFIDCYEVVRELLEDGIITAGCVVGRGGLLTAAEKFRGRKGFTMDIGGVMASTGEDDSLRILFAEIPGVIIEIRGEDYDYIDSQFLLQEIMYFPIGHPDASMHGVGISKSGKNSLGNILASLMSQASEGED